MLLHGCNVYWHVSCEMHGFRVGLLQLAKNLIGIPFDAIGMALMQNPRQHFLQNYWKRRMHRGS